MNIYNPNVHCLLDRYTKERAGAILNPCLYSSKQSSLKTGIQLVFHLLFSDKQNPSALLLRGNVNK